MGEEHVDVKAMAPREGAPSYAELFQFMDTVVGEGDFGVLCPSAAERWLEVEVEVAEENRGSSNAYEKAIDIVRTLDLKAVCVVGRKELVLRSF